VGLVEMLFNGIVEALALILLVSAVAGWWRTRRRRYLVLAAVCLILEAGWTMSFLSGRTPTSNWGYTLIWLIVCAIILVAFRRSDREPEKPLPQDAADEGGEA
jgi:hypothetical protein